MTEREYDSIAQMRGSMSLARCPDPLAFERGNYMRILQTWRGQVPAGPGPQ
jgi:dihydroorotate dehydrogenase (fumarate)